MKNASEEKLRNLARFVCAIRRLRKKFPEHARELDRCVYDVGQKLESCREPNCDCKRSFEEFHAQTNRVIEEELRRSCLRQLPLKEKSYEFN